MARIRRATPVSTTQHHLYVNPNSSSIASGSPRAVPAVYFAKGPLRRAADPGGEIPVVGASRFRVSPAYLAFPASLAEADDGHFNPSNIPSDIPAAVAT